jgi:hypothetical protein
LTFSREGVTFALARMLAYVPPNPVVVTRLSRPDHQGYDLGLHPDVACVATMAAAVELVR